MEVVIDLYPTPIHPHHIIKIQRHILDLKELPLEVILSSTLLVVLEVVEAHESLTSDVEAQIIKLEVVVLLMKMLKTP